jgi:hypothetical protein
MGLMDKINGKLTQLGLQNDRTYKNGDAANGSLTKAKLKFFEKPGKNTSAKVKGVKEIEFFLNPNKISISKTLQIEESKDATPQKTESKPAATDPLKMDLGQMWFDTYDSRENVRKKYIDILEGLLDPLEVTHHAPAVYFVWGSFSSESKLNDEYFFYVKKLDVSYEMFLPDGTPVRASVKMTLQQCNSQDTQVEKQSPDHAKLYTVRRGDTLQGIAMNEYDDPREWRRIADSNSISNPMSVRPGTKLLIPPILR